MASIWVYLGIGIGGLIVGGIFTFIFYHLWNFLYDKFKFKRKLPKDKKGVSKYIEDNKEFFATTGHDPISEKEVVENARRELARTREFEKLRRDAFSKKASGRATRKAEAERDTAILGPGNGGYEASRELPPTPLEDIKPVNREPEPAEQPPKRTVREIKFD